MAEPERTESMYDRVAGEVGIRTLVERFYYLVLSDPTVARYFPTDSIRQGTLRRHFALAVGQVLGGPKFVDDPVAAIHQAHVGLGISAQDYWRVISYLFFTMDKLGVPDDIVAHVSATVWALKDAVVEEEEVHPSYVGQ
jgi:hemoglobin